MAALANCLIARRSLNLSLVVIRAPLFELTSTTTLANLVLRSFASVLRLPPMLRNRVPARFQAPATYYVQALP